MKSSLFFLSILLSFVSCSIDNYDMPSLTLSGKIVDAETGNLVESGGSNAGTIIKLYEGSSAQPLLYKTLPDGNFTNSTVFPGNYSYVAEGPFKTLSATPESLSINKNAEIEIKVIPNIRLATTLIEQEGATAKVVLHYEKTDVQQQLAHLAVVWSTFTNPNTLTFAGGDMLLNDVASLDLSSGDMEFTIGDLQPHTKYYIRGCGRTNNPGNYYNYSTTFEITTP